MRFVRFQTEQSKPSYGWLIDDKVGIVEGSPFSEFRRMEANIPVENVELLPPVSPSKIICVGRNYAAHAEEHGAEVPSLPLLFLKPPSSIIVSGETILLPPQSKHVEHEAELAVVIGRKGRWLTTENSIDHIFGYLVGNDITARDLQRSDNQWTRGKGFDTFCPVGSWIETEFNPVDAMISCHVNGELRQMASTRDMVFTVRQLIAYASSVMTLQPGDIIMTGTPSGVGPLLPGDKVEVTIDGLGSVANPVEADLRAP